jgi:hypothetical protein
LAVAGLVLSLAPAPSAEARPVHVSRQFFGMQDESMKAYHHLQFGSLRLWDAHVTWRDVETAPGVYDWRHLDTLVSAAQSHHVQVTLVLAMTPSFYGPAATLPPTDVDHFRDYVRAVMTRYRSFHGHRGIAAYQVWNEGNVPWFWTGTPHQLARMTRVVWAVHQQVDRRATVVAPSFAVRLGPQRRWLSAYESQRVHHHAVRHYYDANALSLYPRASYHGRLGGPEDAMGLLAQARRRLARAHVPARTPLWVTEVNYGVTGRAVRPIPERRQVANVIRTYLLGAARGITRLFWYRYDWGLLPAAQGGGTLGNTLLSVPGSPGSVTPAGRALRTGEHWLRGRLLSRHGRRPCARDRRGTYRCVVRYAGGIRTIYWNPHRPVRVRVPQSAVAVQTSKGAVTAMRHGQSTVRVSYLPVMVSSKH